MVAAFPLEVGLLIVGVGRVRQLRVSVVVCYHPDECVPELAPHRVTRFHSIFLLGVLERRMAVQD